MGVTRICRLLAAAGMLQACSPASEPKPASEAAAASGVEAITPQNPFFGGWGLEGAKIAPWWDRKGEEPVPDPAMAKISFGAEASAGPPLLTCDKPKYAVNVLSPRRLFDGALPDPAKDAAGMGFNPEGVTTMTFTCASGTADVSLDFPMVNDDTIMLGLNNVIYTYRRTRG